MGFLPALQLVERFVNHVFADEGLCPAGVISKAEPWIWGWAPNKGVLGCRAEKINNRGVGAVHGAITSNSQITTWI